MNIRPEDYLEPNCPLCMQQEETPIDLRRCIEKLDEYLNRNDYAAAERHLRFWRGEALQNRDLRGLLSVENERMGLCRKLGKKEDAMAALSEALSLVEELSLEQTVTAATTYLNAATVYKHFGQAQDALPLYRRTQVIYEKELAPNDARLGGLYNNMALALCDLGQFPEARACYEKALAVMAQAEHGALEMAITELNLANLAEAERGILEAETEIDAHLDRAERLLETETLTRDGYYAFVCEKCAPSFGYYGRFAYAADLQQRAEEIYAGA